MLNTDVTLFPRLAALLCLCASTSGVEMAVAQQHYSLPSAPTYTQVTRNISPSHPRAAQGFSPVRPMATTRQTFTAASQPVVTSVQVAGGYPPSHVPLSSPSYTTANSWMGAPMSVSSPIGQPVYYSAAADPQCTNSHDAGPCDWFCQAQKKLRSLFRASHRRSECKFEYPVSFPSGCPYGYVEPTWSQFCTDPAPQFIGPAY